MVRASEVLDIIEIVYYLPAFLCSLYVVKKQGLSRETGWILITVLAICRLVGSTTGIAAIYKPSKGLITASLITQSIGSATLVATLTGIVNRVNAGTGRKALSPRLTRMLQLIGIVAIVLGIVGGTNQTSSDPDKAANGQTYMKVSVIFILIQFIASSFVALHSYFNLSYVMQGDRRLLFVSLASLPFLLVRVIYSICSAFDHSSSTFSMFSDSTTAVVVKAIMAIAMEFIVVAMFLFGGCTSPQWIKSTESGNRREEIMQQHEQQHQKGYQPVYQAPHYQEQDVSNYTRA